MHNKIANLKYLPDEDKQKLIDYLDFGGYEYAQRKLPELSIFINDYDILNIGNFECLSLNNRKIYYCRSGVNHLGVYFDGDGRILPFSRYYLSNLNSFVEHIDNLLDWINKNPITSFTLKEFSGDFVACEKWFITYGHYQDECFNIYSVVLKAKLKNYTVLLDYPNDSECDTENFKFNRNYEILDNLLFNNNSLNAHNFKNQLITLPRLILIKNNFSNATFHRFSALVSDKLISVVGSLKRKIFLTRSKSYRDIKNKYEIEYFFLQRGYSIINPEQVTLDFLIKIISESDSIALYWGSAMTNLVYCKPLTSVVILKSNSYGHESLEFWSSMISEYNLNVSVISENSDSITSELLKKI